MRVFMNFPDRHRKVTGMAKLTNPAAVLYRNDVRSAISGIARHAVAMMLLVSAATASGAHADTRVDLELVLLADASRSIDDEEIMFQREGYALSITHPDVLNAIGAGYEQRIAVTYVEWGGVDSQEVVVPWSVIDGPSSANAFARKLMATPRIANGPNAIGNALSVAHGLIVANDIAGTRKVIDFSGDSAYSFGGIPISLARAAALSDGITINGLAILCEACPTGRPGFYELETAFGELIIGGPASFVITADRGDRFAQAVRRKLVLEIAGLPASTAWVQRPGPAENAYAAD